MLPGDQFKQHVKILMIMLVILPGMLLYVVISYDHFTKIRVPHQDIFLPNRLFNLISSAPASRPFLSV